MCDPVSLGVGAVVAGVMSMGSTSNNKVNAPQMQALPGAAPAPAAAAATAPEAVANKQKALASAGTILTGGLGDTSVAKTAVKTLGGSKSTLLGMPGQA